MVTRVLSHDAFKFCVALIDTVPFYIGVHHLSRYLHIDPFAEHATGVDCAPAWRCRLIVSMRKEGVDCIGWNATAEGARVSSDPA